MSISKRGNQYQVTYRCHGYSKLFYEYYSSQEEAALRDDQIKLEKKRGTFQPPRELIDRDGKRCCSPETITVRELMEKYVFLYGLNSWSPGVLSDNRHRIDDYILPYIGDERVKDLTTYQLEQFYAMLLEQPAVKLKGHEAENRTVSPSVIAKVHALIRSALNQAIRWGDLLNVNPALTVKLPKYEAAKRTVWSEATAKHALDVCDDPALLLCMYLAIGCSMRIGEILGLQWDCVHLNPSEGDSDEAYLQIDKELIRLRKSSVDALGNRAQGNIFLTFPECTPKESTTVLVLKRPKTESSNRTIYLGQSMIDILSETRQRQKAIQAKLGSKYQDFNLVVAQDNGRPYEEHTILSKLYRLIQNQDLPDIDFHSLRHSSATIKLRYSGGDVKAVQGDTGHATPNMVTELYAHIMADDRKQLAHEVDTRFFSDPKPASDGEADAARLFAESPELRALFLQMVQTIKKQS